MVTCSSESRAEGGWGRPRAGGQPGYLLGAPHAPMLVPSLACPGLGCGSPAPSWGCRVLGGGSGSLEGAVRPWGAVTASPRRAHLPPAPSRSHPGLGLGASCGPLGGGPLEPREGAHSALAGPLPARLNLSPLQSKLPSKPSPARARRMLEEGSAGALPAGEELGSVGPLCSGTRRLSTGFAPSRPRRPPCPCRLQRSAQRTGALGEAP